MSVECLSYCGWYCKRCPDDTCPGRRAGAGDPGCSMRECAKSKDVITCAVCGEFPCAIIGPVLEEVSLLASICEGIKEHGTDKWIEEQNKLVDCKYDFS